MRLSRTSLAFATLAALGLAGALLDRRAPAWLQEDPLVHPFGLDRPTADGKLSPPQVEMPAADEPPSAERPLSLARATAAELCRLPGVGPVLAGRIVALRDSLGGFESLDELMQVKGIGRRRIQRLGPLLRLER